MMGEELQIRRDQNIVKVEAVVHQDVQVRSTQLHRTMKTYGLLATEFFLSRERKGEIHPQANNGKNL